MVMLIAVAVEGMIVAYKIFFTSEPAHSQRNPDQYRVAPVDSDSMGAAIDAACRLIRDGVIVWKIRGQNGFAMERADIEAECRRRQAAHVKR